MHQTWLPLPDYRQSLAALHDEELDRVRWTTLYLLERFHDVEDSELPAHVKRSNQPLNFNSPLWLMWQGHEVQLAEYGLEACEEFSVRHHGPDPVYDLIAFHQEAAISENNDMNKPAWFGDVDFHISHQAALMRTRPSFYKDVFRVVDKNTPLVWPRSTHASQG